jgi:hypothetical protein
MECSTVAPWRRPLPLARIRVIPSTYEQFYEGDTDVSTKRETNLEIEDLQRAQVEELSPEQAGEAKGGIIAILIGLMDPAAQKVAVRDGTSNTVLSAHEMKKALIGNLPR